VLDAGALGDLVAEGRDLQAPAGDDLADVEVGAPVDAG
jgi:hypothetical protein